MNRTSYPEAVELWVPTSALGLSRASIPPQCLLNLPQHLYLIHSVSGLTSGGIGAGRGHRGHAELDWLVERDAESRRSGRQGKTRGTRVGRQLGSQIQQGLASNSRCRLQRSRETGCEVQRDDLRKEAGCWGCSTGVCVFLLPNTGKVAGS